MQFVSSLLLAIAFGSGVGVVALTQSTPEAAQKARYWLNTDSNVRHNEACRLFGSTKIGRYCGPGEGKACRHCGG